MYLCIIYTDPKFMRTAASKTCGGLREECLRLQDKLDDHSLGSGVCVYPSLYRKRNCNCNGSPRRMSTCTCSMIILLAQVCVCTCPCPCHCNVPVTVTVTAL